MNKLYCPHCDEWHDDKQLEINIEIDYVECKITNEEIKTYKFTNSESTIEWRKDHGLKT